MVAPFFQIERHGDDPVHGVEDGKESGKSNQLTEWEAYSLIMIAYPGYTVRGIENELSVREIRELTSTWGKTQPVYMLLNSVETMMAKVHGFKKKSKPKNDNDLLNVLKGEGLLPL